MVGDLFEQGKQWACHKIEFNSYKIFIVYWWINYKSWLWKWHERPIINASHETIECAMPSENPFIFKEHNKRDWFQRENKKTNTHIKLSIDLCRVCFNEICHILGVNLRIVLFSLLFHHPFLFHAIDKSNKSTRTDIECLVISHFETTHKE